MCHVLGTCHQTVQRLSLFLAARKSKGPVVIMDLPNRLRLYSLVVRAMWSVPEYDSLQKGTATIRFAQGVLYDLSCNFNWWDLAFPTASKHLPMVLNWWSMMIPGDLIRVTTLAFGFKHFDSCWTLNLELFNGQCSIGNQRRETCKSSIDVKWP